MDYSVTFTINDLYIIVMDIPRIFKSEFNSYRRQSGTNTGFSDVLLIDRSQTDCNPKVFHLKWDPLTFIQNLEVLGEEFAHLKKEELLYLGEMLKINTLKRIVYLADDQPISYKYLVVVTGKSPIVQLSGALQTLKDALLIDAVNVKAKIQQTLTLNVTKKNRFATGKQSLAIFHDQEATLIAKVARHHLPAQAEGILLDLSISPQTLCQIKM